MDNINSDKINTFRKLLDSYGKSDFSSLLIDCSTSIKVTGEDETFGVKFNLYYFILECPPEKVYSIKNKIDEDEDVFREIVNAIIPYETTNMRLLGIVVKANEKNEVQVPVSELLDKKELSYVLPYYHITNYYRLVVEIIEFQNVPDERIKSVDLKNKFGLKNILDLSTFNLPMILEITKIIIERLEERVQKVNSNWNDYGYKPHKKLDIILDLYTILHLTFEDIKRDYANFDLSIERGSIVNQYPTINDVEDCSVFISYSTKDSDKYRISEIAEKLEQDPKIRNVYYYEGWEGFPDGNIVTFMEEFISISQFFVPFCSENYINSPNCEKERKYSILKNIINIPIFENFDYVKGMSGLHKGIDIVDKNSKQTIEEILKRIHSILSEA